MTLVAKSLQERCKAFTEKRRSCRLSCAQGKNTCNVHKNYFTNWFQKNGYLTMETMENTKLRKYKEFDAVIGKILPIPKSYVTDIYPSEDYIPFYIYLCNNGADPFWNKECFIMTIRIAVNDVFNNIFNNNSLLLQELEINSEFFYIFDALFISYEYKKEGLKYIILYTFYKLLYLYDIYNNNDDKEFILVPLIKFTFNNLLRYTNYKILLFSDLSEIIKSVKDILTVNNNSDIIEYFMNVIILSSIEETKTKMISIIRNRCDIFKEDLMAYVYYPDRIFKLINAHGINILDNY